MLKSNFEVTEIKSQPSDKDARAEFRKRALESISGSMVFVEDEILYWDILDE